MKNLLIVLLLGLFVASCSALEQNEITQRKSKVYNACMNAIVGENAISELKEKRADAPLYCAKVVSEFEKENHKEKENG